MPEELPPPATPADHGELGMQAVPWKRGSAPGLPSLAEEGDGDVTRYLVAFWRFRWLIGGAGIVGLAVGIAASRYVKPVYEAQATIWIETPPERNTEDRGPIRQQQLLTASGWVDLMKSYLVLDHAVSRLKLYLATPAGVDSALFSGFALTDRFRPGQYRLSVDKTGRLVTLATGAGAVVERVALGDSLGRSVGFSWAPSAAALPPGTDVKFGVTAPRDAALALADQLQIATYERGNFLKVTLDGPASAALAKVLNALTERFVQVAGELKRDKLAELARILGDQLHQAERNLRESENQLQSFRVQTITLPSDRATPLAPGLTITQDPVLQGFFDQKIELEQVRRDRDAIQRGLVQAGDSGLSTDALEIIGSVQKSTELMAALKELTDKRAELRALRYRYTDTYPPVLHLANTIQTLERRSIPAIAQALIGDLTARERELDQRVQSASQELQQIPTRTIQEARLQRDVDIAGALYTTLQQRYEEARLADVSSIPDVRILDAAVPPGQPIRNRAIYFVLMGLFGGLGAGAGSALLLHRFDRRVRYPEQVTSEMGLPILGVIPYLGGRNGKAASEAMPVIEAVRGVRLNVTHAYGAAGPMLITVSSPAAGDGKSFVASNLALSFAHAGQRTLLIDGDTRRGGLHRVVRGHRKPGLTDALAGRSSAEGVVGKTEFPHLFFIGCGSRMQNAPELLSAPMLVQMLTSFRSSYGVIIVDSPPLMAGVDAFALGAATGNLLLVLRTGATDREMAENKLGVLDRLPIRILGAVVNAVKDWSPYRYYSYYLEGYETEDEDGRGEGKKLLGGVG